MESPRLHLLPAEVVSSLRSSVIVGDVATCLQELVYNALDAGATDIQVSLDLPAWAITVNDDGHGIRGHDMAHIGQRYWTSKHSTFGAGDQSTYYGFRGESLASIAETATIEVVSRYQSSSETHGTLFRGGRRIYCGATRAGQRLQAGTTVSVRDLFYKWPVRRKSLAANPTNALGSARWALQLIALVHPSISFRLLDGSRIPDEGRLLRLRGSDQSVEARWRSLWGGELLKTISCVDENAGGIHISGFLSFTASHSKKYQLIFVNERFIPSGDLHRAINARFSQSSFATLNEAASRHAHLSPTPTRQKHEEKVNRTPRKAYDRHPVYLLLLRLPPDCLNISRESGLTSLVLKNEPSVTTKLVEVTEAFLETSGLKTASPKRRLPPVSTSSPVASPLKRSRRSMAGDFLVCCASDQAPLDVSDSRHPLRQKPMNTIDLAAVGRLGEVPPTVRKGIEGIRRKEGERSRRMLAIETTPLMELHALSRQDLHSAQFIGQVDRTFLLCRINGILVMVDQHAADERIHVERFLAELSGPEGTKIRQQVLLNASEVRQLKDNLLAFAQWGLAIDLLDTVQASTDHAQVCVSAVPAVVAQRFRDEPRLLAELIKNHLAYLEEFKSSPTVGGRQRWSDCPSILLDMINSKACRAAIMFGELMREEQVERLLAQVADANLPFQCAHGRPSMLPLAGIPRVGWKEEALRWDLFR